jgi:hypothetical protein
MRMHARTICLAAALTATLLGAREAAAGTQGTILYDQATTAASGYAPSVDLPPEMDAFDSAGADDFLVDDPAGWSVGRFNFGAFPTPNATFAITVYADAGGLPGPTVVCSYAGLSGSQHGFDRVRVPLPTPCDLPQGTYWVSFVGEPGTSLVWGAQFPVLLPPFFSGAPARWQNPGDGHGSGCTSWTNVQNCFIDGSEDPITNFADAFQFQVCGTPGAGSGGGDSLCGDESASVAVALTLAADNGDPNQCGAATSLDVDQGGRVNFCYTVTNTSAATLDYQWLHDSAAGELFAHEGLELAPGASLQFNRTAEVVASRSYLATWTSADLLPNYVSSTRTNAGTFVDIAGVGTPLDLSDDGSANVTMPFAFAFYGVASNLLCINNNGFVLFQTDAPCVGYNQDASIPTAFRFPAVMPFWDDLYTGGNVYYATLGTEPNRRFVVEWSQKNHYDDGADDPGGVTFEVIFDEATGTISFEYQDMAFDNAAHPEWDRGGSATVGLDYDGSLIHSQGFHAAVYEDDSALDFVPIDVTLSSAIATATVNVAAPGVTVMPAAIEAVAEGGAPVTRSLAIGNTGSLDLHWDLGASRSPRGHFPIVPAFVAPLGDPGAADWQRMPREKVAAARSSTPLPIPFGGFATMAYGLRFTFVGWEYDRFDDLSDPTVTTHVGTPHDLFYAGDFINGDFSKEYIINEANSFATISTADGSVTYNYGSVENSPEILFWLGMTWDASTQTLYAVGLDPFVEGPPHAFLATIDISHGARSTTIGQFPLGVLMIDIAVDSAGHLYGLDIASDALMAIDTDTAEVEAIGSIGFNANFAQDMDFDDATGVLYLAGVDGDSEVGSLYTVNTLTGAATPIGPLNAGEQYDGFAIVSGAPCLPPQSVPWLSVDPASGTTAPGGSSIVNVTLDPGSLGNGTHEANVCVFTNDLLNPRVVVPVTFSVTGSDGIFADGFD